MPHAAGSKGREGPGGHLLTKQGSGCPDPLATAGSRRLREVRRGRGGCQGEPGHSRAEAPPKARSRDESFEIASKQAPRTGPSRAPRLASAPDGASEGLRQRCERPLPAAWRGVKAQNPLVIYLFIGSNVWVTPRRHLSTEKNQTTSGPKREQEEWDSSLDPLHWEEGEQKERKKIQKSHASTKPVDYCRSFLLHWGQIFYWQPCNIKASCWLCSSNILFLDMGKQVSKINQYCHSETIYPKFNKGKGDRNQVCLWKKKKLCQHLYFRLIFTRNLC